jgi:hypothetical protein
MTTRIIILLAFGAAMTVPVILGFVCHAYREDRLARFNPAMGHFVSHIVAATNGFIAAWMLFGIWFVFSPRFSSPWVVILGVVGLILGSLFGLTTSMLEWHANRAKKPGMASRQFASKGPLWDAELDR